VNLPYFANDPGFNNDSAYPGFPNGNVLPTMKTLGINVLTNLQYWDGADAGSISFAAAPGGVELGLELGVEVRISGAGQTGIVPNVGNTGAGGRLHVHFNSRLYFNGESSPIDPDAPDGIYLVGLQLKMDGFTNSDPFYVVYNNDSMGLLGEEIHDAAIDWVEVNLVPEPASFSIAAVALVGLVFVGRTRRRRPARL
jgi:MYXO-CTERM domain-containing protein